MKQITIEYIYNDKKVLNQEDINSFIYQMKEHLNDFEPEASFKFIESEMCFGNGIIIISEPLHTEQEIIDNMNDVTDYVPCEFKKFDPF